MISVKNKKTVMIILTITLISLLIIGNSLNTAPKRKFKKTRNLMGTDVTIQVYGSNEEKSMNAIKDAFTEIERIENLASRYDESSELYKLNHQKKLNNPSKDLRKLIRTSKHYYNVTNGAFDITVLPLLNLWSNDLIIFEKNLNHIEELNQNELPDNLFEEFKDYEPSLGNLNKDPEISKEEDILGRGVEGWLIEFKEQRFYVIREDDHLKAFTKLWLLSYGTQERFISQKMDSIGSDKIKITNNSITIEEDMLITLDGIAKGYAVDKAIKTLKSRNIDSALINAGGDITTLGTKPDGAPWIIGLRNPQNKSQSIMELELSGESIATSGNYERYFNQDASVGHIMNPLTGRSPTKVSSATIIAENSTESDVLATASFALGTKKAENIVENMNDVEGIFLDYENPRNITRTSGMKNLMKKD